MSLADDRARALKLTPVSRETAARLDVLVHELMRWQTAKNLVGPATLDQVWTRHVADSVQLLAHAPCRGRWLDLGSGGGFPGLVIAILRQEADLGPTSLVESNGRKCAFLRHAARLTGSQAVIHHARIEDFIGMIEAPVSVVSARALAPLSQLLAWSDKLLRTGAVGIFPKGQDVDNELADSAISGGYQIQRHASVIDPKGCIVTVRRALPEAT